MHYTPTVDVSATFSKRGLRMNIQLLHTIGKSYVDETVADVVQQFEQAFPARVRGYYLLGSYADGCAVVGSDIDMYVLFKETFLTSKEAIQAKQLAATCAKKCILRLDISVVDEQTLPNYQSIMRVALKRNSILYFGEDTRPSMTLPDRAAYTRDITDGVIEFLLYLHRSKSVTYPVSYIDPNGEFYGYDNMTKLSFDVAALYYPPAKADNVYYAIRELVECACRMASALLVFKTGTFVGMKRTSAEAYNKEIHDEWSPFLAAMFEKGKMQWMYGIPEREEEQAELRELCRQMLAFENYYLQHYRTYLLALLASEDQQNVQFVLKRLETVHYDDDEMNTAVNILDIGKRKL